MADGRFIEQSLSLEARGENENALRADRGMGGQGTEAVFHKSLLTGGAVVACVADARNRPAAETQVAA